MTPGEILAVAGGFGGPLSGVVIALIANHRSKQTANASTRVSEKEVKVSEQEADTHQFAAVIEGFTQQVAIANANYDRLAAAHTELSQNHTSLRDAHGSLEHRFEESERAREDMLRHIVALEQLVPNPPGPPPRPF